MENYLLSGEENGDILQFISNVIKTHPDSEVRRFISKDDSNSIIDFLNEESLFNPTRICIITCVSDLDLSFTKSLVSYLKESKDNASLIVNCANFKIPSNLRSSFKNENIHTFYPMYENQRVSFVRSLLAKDRISIETDALNIFLDMCENTKDSMTIAVDQIIAFIKSKGSNSITREHVSTFLSHTRVETVQSLYLAILDRKSETALRILSVLLNSKAYEASIIAIQLNYSFLSLLKVKEEELESDLKTALSTIKYPKLRFASEKALRYYSKQDIENIMFGLANQDVFLKESDSDIKQIILENLIVNIINKNFVDNSYFFFDSL